MKKSVKVYLGADHAGFALKEKIKEFLSKKDIYFEDLGSYDENSEDDYPDFAFKVGEKVIKHRKSKGILVCGTGIGMTIAANKIKGIRAAMVYDENTAKMSREHNDANVLSLSTRFLSEDQIKFAIELFLTTKFSEDERHVRRIAKF